jgi:hypothetical protein
MVFSVFRIKKGEEKPDPPPLCFCKPLATTPNKNVANLVRRRWWFPITTRKGASPPIPIRPSLAGGGWPWRAPWWTGPPPTTSSAPTGLRTWRSATSATATPGTDPLSLPRPPCQIPRIPARFDVPLQTKCLPELALRLTLDNFCVGWHPSFYVLNPTILGMVASMSGMGAFKRLLI